MNELQLYKMAGLTGLEGLGRGWIKVDVSGFG